VSELAAGVIGGAVGGMLGVLGTTVSSYWGPRRLEQWRQEQHDEPRKQLLLRMLEDDRFPDGRTLARLHTVTGSSSEECRRLLIQVGARGVVFPNDVEGWALISRKPLDGDYTSGGTPDA
jgi:hypothetical protein